MKKNELLRVLQRTLDWYVYGAKANNDGVCVALEKANPRDRYQPHVTYLQKKYFSNPEGFTFVPAWLYFFHPKVADQAMKRYGSDWKRQYRMAWIKHVMEHIRNEIR